VTSPRSYLFSLEQIGIKLGLDQIRALVEHLGAPHTAYPSMLVAGTNGKGSVTAMLERGLRAAGYRTGRYTSPHLTQIEERVAIDGLPIAADVFDAAADRVRDASQALSQPPSFFEATTALALDVFRREAVDIAVLEVGMGGRLDATNIAPAMAAAITLVDFDHEHYLGRTLEAIAGEKAGIVKPGTLVVLAENPAAVEVVVADACTVAGATLVRASVGVTSSVEMEEGRAIVNMTTPRARYRELRLGLRGAHQVANALTAVRLLEETAGAGLIRAPGHAIRSAVEDVVWPARLELLDDCGTAVLIDGAHNAAGARALAAHVQDTYHRRLPIVLGVMRDKAIGAIVGALAPAASHFFCVAASSERAATPAELLAIAHAEAPEVPASAEPSPLAGLRRAETTGAPVVVAGSLYLAGEIRSILA